MMVKTFVFILFMTFFMQSSFTIININIVVASTYLFIIDDMQPAVM